MIKRLIVCLFICIFSLCSIFSQSAETSPDKDVDREVKVLTLKEIDLLIKETRYDVALFELNKYINIHPEQFDKVQKRIGKIMKSRDLYTILANRLLDLIRNDPENTEKLGQISDQLMSIERNPNDRRLEIIKNTNDIAALARYSLIQNKTEEDVLNGNFMSAIKRARTAFFIYREDFNEVYAGSKTYSDVEKFISGIDALISRYEAIQPALIDVRERYVRTAFAGDGEGAKKILSESKQLFSDFALIINSTNDIGNSFADMLKTLGSKKEGRAEAFLRYIKDGIFGWNGEENRGIFGVMEGQWNAVLLQLKEAGVNGINANFTAFYSSAAAENISSFFSGSDKNLLLSAILLSEASVSVNSMHSMIKNRSGKGFKDIPPNFDISNAYASDFAKLALSSSSYFSDIAKIKVETQAYGFSPNSYALELSGQRLADFLLLNSQKIEEIASSIKDSIAENSSLNERYNSLLGSKKRKTSGQAVLQTQQMTPISKNFAVPLEGDKFIDWVSIASSTDLVLTSLLTEIENENALLYARFGLYYESCAKQYLLSAEKEHTLAADYITGKAFLSGQLLADGIIRKYPKDAISVLDKLSAYILSVDKVLAYSLSRLKDKNYKEAVSYYDSINNIMEKIKGISTSNLYATASSMLRNAKKSKIEADLRYAQAERALKNEDFSTARSRLEEAGNRYVESLSYSEDAELRTSVDKKLSSLGEMIKTQENIIVVQQVRQLKNLARTEYYNGNFSGAEKLLNQAKLRWAVTNVEEDSEITNFMALVENALFMKTGRNLQPSDPLYPEMSQLLNIAAQFYRQGAELSKKGETNSAQTLLKESLEKLEELRLVYPLNQEASLLALRIQQLQNPKEFQTRFAERVNSAKSEYKQSSKQRQVYTDLLDLYEINPNYPGLKKLIYDVELEIGIRKKEVANTDLSRSKSLTSQARATFNSAGRNEDKLRQALKLADDAIKLNADNKDAILLKDEISIRLGGSASVVLSAQDQERYNQAVQALQNNNIILANAIVEQLLQKDSNKSSARILELQKRIQARM